MSTDGDTLEGRCKQAASWGPAGPARTGTDLQGVMGWGRGCGSLEASHGAPPWCLGSGWAILPLSLLRTGV